MRFTRALLVLALIGASFTGVFAVAGCSKKDVAAKVNGETISAAEINQQLEQYKKSYPDMFSGADGPARLADFRQRVLDNLVNAKLVEQSAKQKGILVSDADIQKQLDQLRAGFKDQAQFDAAIKSSGVTLDSLKNSIRQQMVTNKLMEQLSADQKVTDKEIAEYYQTNKSQFLQQAQKRPSHILFKTADKSTAQKVLKQLKAGTISFAAAAKKHSIDKETKDKGGDLGWPTVSYVPEFQAALDKLDKGAMSGLVQSTYGYHIITVTDTRAAKQRKLAEVKAEIREIIIQKHKAEAYQKYLDELRKKAKIDILLDDLKSGADKKSPTPSGSK